MRSFEDEDLNKAGSSSTGQRVKGSGGSVDEVEASDFVEFMLDSKLKTWGEESKRLTEERVVESEEAKTEDNPVFDFASLEPIRLSLYHQRLIICLV